MTTDTQLTPPDAEIVALMGDPRYSTIGAVREAISRWGSPSTPPSPAEFALQSLVAAGHVSQELVDKAMALPGAPQSAHSGEPVACGNCGGTGWMVRDPDIGTDQECFVCDGSGGYSEPSTPQPTQAQAGAVESAEFGQFLSDVLTAAGLVTHGKQCKALGERIADMCMKLRIHGIKGGQHGADT